MTTTNRYSALHTLDAKQRKAVIAVASGLTHAEAAKSAGVHRVTVTNWANHHPAFIAELHRLDMEAERETRAAVSRTTQLALQVVSSAIEEGSVEEAFRWLRLGTLPQAATPAAPGPTDSHAVVEGVRASLPDVLELLILDPPCR